MVEVAGATDPSLRTDLAAPSGASLVGYLPAGAGAVATTVQGKLRETVSVFDFLPADQIALIKAYNSVGQDAAIITEAVMAAATANTRAVFFPKGLYLHTGLHFNETDHNRIQLIGEGYRKTQLLCTSAGSNSISMTATTAFFVDAVIMDLTITGDNTNGAGIYGNGIANYTFVDVYVEKQGSHGIHLTDTGTPASGSYGGYITRARCAGNTGDGYYHVGTSGSSQANASYAENCEFQGNANGATIWGMGIHIHNCTIQGNTGKGIRVQNFLTAGPVYSAIGVSIKNNYFESNYGGHIYIKTDGTTSGYLLQLSVEDNVGYQNLTTIGVGYKAFEIDSGSQQSEVQKLTYKSNNWTFAGGTPTVQADFGGNLGADCVVIIPNSASSGQAYSYLTSRLASFVNFGLAKVLYSKNYCANGWFGAKGSGIAYSSATKSDNITVSGSTCDYAINVPYMADLQYITLPVETDSTNYSITFALKTRSDSSTAAHSNLIVPVISGNGSSLIVTSHISSYTASSRITSANCDMYLRIVVTITTPGTYFYIGNPSVWFNN